MLATPRLHERLVAAALDHRRLVPTELERLRGLPTLCASEVLVADQLFATLDTTVRTLTTRARV